jgi:hypothetical protein
VFPWAEIIETWTSGYFDRWDKPEYGTMEGVPSWVRLGLCGEEMEEDVSEDQAVRQRDQRLVESKKLEKAKTGPMLSYIRRNTRLSREAYRQRSP